MEDASGETYVPDAVSGHEWVLVAEEGGIT